MNQNNPLADLFKNSFDFNQGFSTQRRNIEAFSTATQALAEGCQAAARCSAEALRSNTESLLKTSKDMFNGGTPDVSMTKQAEFAKSMFESTLANLREMSEMLTKSSFEAFEVINKRCTESMQEISKVSNAATKRKAS